MAGEKKLEADGGTVKILVIFNLLAMLLLF